MTGRLPAVTFRAAVALAVFGGCTESALDTAGETLPVWTASLDLRIGSIDDPEYSLTFIRDIETSPDGRIYTLHPMDQTIRIFRPDGTSAGSIGGQGGGPSEFQNLGEMGWVADTLWALDFSGSHFKQFNADGDYLGSFTVPFVMGEDPGSPSPPRARGLLFDGTVHGAPPSFSRQVVDGTLTADLLLLLDREGGVRDTVASIPFGHALWAISDPDDPRQPMAFMEQPFADGPLWAFSPVERALVVLERPAPDVGPESAFRVSKLGFDGDTLFSREYRYPALPVLHEEVDSLLDARSEEIGNSSFFNMNAARARQIAEASLYRPPFKPPVTEMVLGKNGSIWVRRQPATDGGVDWLVLSEGGEAVGQVRLPSGMDLHAVDLPYVWGAEADELGVPYVVRYRVNRAEEEDS